MKRPPKAVAVGVSIVLSTQLVTTRPAQAFGLDSVSGILGDVLSFAMPFIQQYAGNLLQGINIDGINLSSVIMDTVFGQGGLLSGGGLNLGSLMGTLGSDLSPVLSQSPFGQPLYNILSGAITNGSLSPDTVLNSGIIGAVVGQIKDGNPNPNIDLSIDPSDGSRTFGNQGMTAQDIVDGIQNGTIAVDGNGNINTASGGSNGTNGTNGTDGTTVGSGGGVTGTGSTTCLYANTCTRGSSNQAIYSAATGAQGFPNPNEVRGQIYQEATSGKSMTDIYSANHYTGAFYAGNQSDRDINRATTEEFLSKAGQKLQQHTLDNIQKTVEGTTDLVKKCSSKAKSTQELARCSLVVDGVGPAFAGAQLSTLMGIRKDNQFAKIQLGNISATMDAQRRHEDVENAGMSVATQQRIWAMPDKW
jgi:hypothetical protein